MRTNILFLLLTLPSSIGSTARADGVNFADAKKTYPEEKYFIAIGNGQDPVEGQARDIATEAARGELVKSLRATIKATTQATRSVEESKGSGHSIASAMANTYRQMIEVKSEIADLTNVEVTKLTYNEDTHEAQCLVVLDRKQFADATRPKLAETGRLIQSYLSEMSGEEKQMRRIQLLKKAMIEFQKSAPLAEIYNIAAPSGQPSSATILGTSFEGLMTKLYHETASLNISIEVDGSSEIGSAISAEVNRAGFRVKNTASIKLKVSIQARIPQDRLLSSAGIAIANGKVLSEIYEDGVKISSFTLDRTASAQVQSDALERLKNEMKKQIVQEYINGLLASF